MNHNRIKNLTLSLTPFAKRGDRYIGSPNRATVLQEIGDNVGAHVARCAAALREPSAARTDRAVRKRVGRVRQNSLLLKLDHSLYDRATAAYPVAAAALNARLGEPQPFLRLTASRGCAHELGIDDQFWTHITYDPV
jgi:hypothetical protein